MIDIERKRACSRECQRRYRERNREKVNAAALAYKARNRERTLAANREWKRANQERVREYGRLYRSANREAIRAQEKAHKDANKERYREQQRAYYQANAERRREVSRAYRERFPEKILDYSRRYREENRQILCLRVRLRNLPITANDLALLDDAQGSVCAICGKAETSVAKGTLRSLAIDHCHDTGLVRGLLCARCNQGLGHFGDDPELLIAAIAYLADPPAPCLLPTSEP